MSALQFRKYKLLALEANNKIRSMIQSTENSIVINSQSPSLRLFISLNKDLSNLWTKVRSRRVCSVFSWLYLEQYCVFFGSVKCLTYLWHGAFSNFHQIQSSIYRLIRMTYGHVATCSLRINAYKLKKVTRSEVNKQFCIEKNQKERLPRPPYRLAIPSKRARSRPSRPSYVLRDIDPQPTEGLWDSYDKIDISQHIQHSWAWKGRERARLEGIANR